MTADRLDSGFDYRILFTDPYLSRPENGPRWTAWHRTLGGAHSEYGNKTGDYGTIIATERRSVTYGKPELWEPEVSA